MPDHKPLTDEELDIVVVLECLAGRMSRESKACRSASFNQASDAQVVNEAIGTIRTLQADNASINERFAVQAAEMAELRHDNTRLLAALDRALSVKSIKALLAEKEPECPTKS